jgi:hypothetical protein
VFTQGIILRQLLLSKNKPNPSNIEESGREFRTNNLARQVWVPQAANVGTSLEYGTSNTHFELLLATREVTGGMAVRGAFDESGSPTKKAVEEQASWIGSYNFNLQNVYGTFEKTSSEPFRSKLIFMGKDILQKILGCTTLRGTHLIQKDYK